MSYFQKRILATFEELQKSLIEPNLSERYIKQYLFSVKAKLHTQAILYQLLNCTYLSTNFAE